MSQAMTRDVKEWIGKRNEPIPPRVRMRVFERYAGICQCGCTTAIAGKPWQVDHVQALINGGSNCESNLVPLLADHHKIKTRADVATKAKTARIVAARLGIKPKGRPMPGSRASGWKRCMDGTVVRRDGQ
jgi:5-methylcytosine-specific restriction enzyme A